MRSSWLILILMAIILLAFWQGRPSLANRIRRHIEHVLDELNSKYPHDRLSFGEEELDGNRVRTLHVYDGNCVPVIRLDISPDEDVELSMPHYRNMRGLYGRGDLAQLFNRIEEVLKEHHRRHVVVA